jgi:hypothetical protein
MTLICGQNYQEYYTDWTIKVFDVDTLIYIYRIDLENHKVFISLSLALETPLLGYLMF